MSRISHQKGFTLVELMLYVAISASLLLAISLYVTFVLQSRIKNQTVAEVEQQGIHVMDMMTQAVRNGESITAPAQGNSGGSLVMDVISSSNDPTVFDVSSGVLQIKEGISSTIPLTNSRVSVSGLSVYNISHPSTPGAVRIQFTVSHINPSGRPEYDYAKTFYATAALRQP